MIYTYTRTNSIRPSDIYANLRTVETCLTRLGAVFGGFRPPLKNENFVDPPGARVTATYDYPPEHPRVIVKQREYKTETPADFWD